MAKLTKWQRHVQVTYKELKRKNSKVSFSDALKKASKTWKG